MPTPQEIPTEAALARFLSVVLILFYSRLKAVRELLNYTINLIFGYFIVKKCNDVYCNNINIKNIHYAMRNMTYNSKIEACASVCERLLCAAWHASV